jgi:hypothetical protein
MGDFHAGDLVRYTKFDENIPLNVMKLTVLRAEDDDGLIAVEATYRTYVHNEEIEKWQR